MMWVLLLWQLPLLIGAVIYMRADLRTISCVRKRNWETGRFLSRERRDPK